MDSKNNQNNLHVVYGANGGMGAAVMRALAAQGKRVRAVTRSGLKDAPEGVEHFQADATGRDAAIEAGRGAAVIYHCINVPYTDWAARLDPILSNLLDAAEASGARLVYGDNLYMYGPVDEPLREDLPYRAQGKKGRLRAALADRLKRVHQEGRVPVVIGRASDFLGPGAANTITGQLVIEPALKGERAMWSGSLDAPHSLSYIDDVGRGLAVLGERDEALGQVWHIPAMEPVTGRQFIEMVFEELDRPPRYGVYAPLTMRLVGFFSPQVREVTETLYQFAQPFVLDAGKFERAFGPFDTTPLRQGIRETIAWYRKRLDGQL